MDDKILFDEEEWILFLMRGWSQHMVCTISVQCRTIAIIACWLARRCGGRIGPSPSAWILLHKGMVTKYVFSPVRRFY